jgi:hypothetical protein
MADTAFKTPAEPDISPAEKGLKSSNDTHSEVDSEIPVPFKDYESQNGKPFTVDHYELSNTWKDRDGGFGEEVATIEAYLNNQIDIGEIENSQEAIKKELKKIEKLTNMKDEGRIVIKIGNIAAYAEFLMKTDNIKYNSKKYYG